MPYVSELDGKPISDVDGEYIGTLQDLLAVPRADTNHPEIVALLVKHAGGPLMVSVADVVVLVAPAIALKCRARDVVPYAPGPHDLYLIRDVLDKQIIDTNGIRVVRVNDLELARLNGRFYVANVDIGAAGLLRRMGLARAAAKVAARLGRKLPTGVISWDVVELLPGNQPMRLKVPSERIADLHPADLAEIISDLSRLESSQLLESLDVKTLADTLEEVEPEFQASLVEAMSDEKVADLLEEMSPDEAADLLAELPAARSEEILNLMEDEDAQDVRLLLTYPEDSAGGIMTTEFISVHPDLSAAEAIDLLRQSAHDIENFFYVYVTDQDNRLQGLFSLQELILAAPGTPVADFMEDRVAHVRLLDSQDAVAQAVSKYNLMAIPVVDDAGRLQGIVTADDALDKIIPTAWKKRLPRMYR